VNAVATHRVDMVKQGVKAKVQEFLPGGRD
jgi:hypothetical protein